VSVIFYAVPETNPLGPPTVFTDRWWDYKEGFLRSGVGTDNKWRVYTGPLPNIPVKAYEGQDSWWTNGLSYAAFLAGDYHNTGPCITIPPTEVAPTLQGVGGMSATVEFSFEIAPTLQGVGTMVDGEEESLVELPGKGGMSVTLSNEWSSEVVLPGVGTMLPDGVELSGVELPGVGTMVDGEEESLVELPGVGAMTDET